MSELTEPVLISSIFMLIGMFLFQVMGLRNWFKKESWKIEFTSIKKKNELQLKKMARDLNVNYSGSQKGKAEPATGGGLADRFLPTILQNLSPEQTAALAEKFIGGDDEGESGDIGDTVLKYAMKNPDLVNKFLGGQQEQTINTDYE